MDKRKIMILVIALCLVVASAMIVRQMMTPSPGSKDPAPMQIAPQGSTPGAAK